MLSWLLLILVVSENTVKQLNSSSTPSEITYGAQTAVKLDGVFFGHFLSACKLRVAMLFQKLTLCLEIMSFSP